MNEILNFKVSNPYFPHQPLTVRQLATHTSGIIDREKVYERTYVFGQSRVNVALDAFLRSYLTKKGKFYSRRNFDRRQPGTAFNYSNIGATLAARLIEVKAVIDDYLAADLQSSGKLVWNHCLALCLIL